MPDEQALSALTPALRAFVLAHRIPSDALRADGRVVITVDERWRVHAQSAPHGRLALQSELLGLSEPPDARDADALMRLAQAAAGLLQRHASTLCIDRSRQALVLQQLLPASATQAELEEALADFTNALSFWTSLSRETGRTQRAAVHAMETLR